MSDLTEEQIAGLIAALPPAPAGWVRAAQELPAARQAIDTLVQRAQADANQRRATLAGLEAALEAEGVAPHPRLVQELRARLDD
jgi:hypothetical protein